MANAAPPSDAVTVEVNGRVIDPEDHYAKDARGTDHIVLSVYDVLTSTQKAALEERKVEFLEDLGSNNFLCRYEPADLKPLRALGFVRQADVYRNMFKIPANLLSVMERVENTSTRGDKTLSITVMTHQGVSDLQALADEIAANAGVDRSNIEVLNEKLLVNTEPKKLPAIAADDRVRVIEEVLAPVLDDGEANLLVLTSQRAQGIEKLRGKDQVIAVVDTGIDLGSAQDCHPAFDGRIDGLISLGRAGLATKNEAERYDDPVGHGTHVCGTIVGQEFMTSQGLVGGIAPEAKIVVTSFMKDRRATEAVTDIKKVFSAPYTNNGACVQSNSWGDNLDYDYEKGVLCQRPYGTAAGEIDAFVRENPEVLVVFSAGNNNKNINEKNTTSVLWPALGSQAAAKNCLTVGASGSTRAATDPARGLLQLDPDKMCEDSSRGPSQEKRTKPDVVAPGYNIFSAVSRHGEVRYSAASATSEGHAGVKWNVRHGTSHATPLVSGCGAVLREMAQKRGLARPPAALLKAVLINGAYKLPNVDQDAQGFGRVNLHASATMLEECPYLGKDNGVGSSLSLERGSLIGEALDQGQQFEFNLKATKQNAGDVPNPEQKREFRITMVYNDLPGKQIQNNLNLYVVDAATGAVHHGGMSEDEIDVQNNVEQVVLMVGPSQELRVGVRAQKIFAGSNQDFALAWWLGSHS